MQVFIFIVDGIFILPCSFQFIIEVLDFLIKLIDRLFMHGILFIEGIILWLEVGIVILQSNYSWLMLIIDKIQIPRLSYGCL